jgi:hypothetical protein
VLLCFRRAARRIVGRDGWRANCPIPTLEHTHIRPSWDADRYSNDESAAAPWEVGPSGVSRSMRTWAIIRR